MQGLYIGEEAAQEGQRGDDTIGWRGQGPGRATMSSGAHRAHLWQLSSVLDGSGKNRNLGVDFV